MCSIKLNDLTAEYPEDRDAINKLLELVEHTPTQKELSLKRIYDITHFTSPVTLAAVLNELVAEGILKKIIRVESEAGGIKDFSSFGEIPSVIHDWRRDIEMAVLPENLLSLYKVLEK